VLRLSPHLLGAFLLEEGVGFALRGCQQFVELRGLRGCEGVGLESALHVRGGVCEAGSTNIDHQGYRGLRCWGGEELQTEKLDCVAFADLQPCEPVGNGAPDHVVAFGAFELATPSVIQRVYRV
jgi:hypothetical protein